MSLQICKFLMKSMWTWKKESIVYWCCHFKLATNILMSFSNVAYNFSTFVGVNSNGLSIKNVGNNWARCWAFVNFLTNRGLSPTSKESKGYALRSKLGGLRPYQLALITLPIQLGIGWNYHQKKWNFKSFPTICK